MEIFVFIRSKPLLWQCRQSCQHLWRKARVSFIQEKKNVLYSWYTRILTVDFYWKFSKEIYPEHWLENFLCTMHLICFVRFLKNILVYAVPAGDLAKFLMQTFATAKTKSCSFSNNEFHCCLGVCFPGFKSKQINRQIWL